MSIHTDRLEYIDNLKALSTVMVVLLHSYSVIGYQYGAVSNFTWSVAMLYDSFVRCAVPLFLVANGITVLTKTYPLRDWIIKKICLRILGPMFLYSTLYWNQHATFFNPLSICYHFNFIGIIVTLYILYPILSKFCISAKPSEKIYFAFIWIVSILLLTFKFTFTLFEINFIFLYIGYPVVGLFLSQLHIKNIQKISLALYITFSLVTFYLIYITSYKIKTLDEHYFSYLSINVLLMTFSIFLFIKNCTFDIKNPLLLGARNFLSQHSYGIFFIHPYFLEKAYYLHNELPVIFSGLAICAFGLTASMLTIFIMIKISDKLPFVNKINRALIG